MARATPAKFKRIVAKTVDLEADKVKEYGSDRDGGRSKVVAVTLYDQHDTVVRVDWFKGDAEIRFFTRDRAYHLPKPWSVIEVKQLTKALDQATQIVEAVYGSGASEV